MKLTLNPRSSFALGVASLLIIGVVDTETGYELNFFVFYFIPVSLVAWCMPLGWGLAMSLACSITWFAADRISGNSYTSYFFLYWNTGVRLVSFLAIAVTVNKISRLLREERFLNEELTQALAQVKQLSGMLPICASCKKVRNDTGYWEQIESYVTTHSEAVFSHGICPTCMEELYPEYCKEITEASNNADAKPQP